MMKIRTLLKRELPQNWIEFPCQVKETKRYITEKQPRFMVWENIHTDDLSNLPRTTIHLKIHSSLTIPCLKDIDEIIDIFIGQAMIFKACKMEIVRDNDIMRNSVEAWFTYNDPAVEEYINSSREERKL